MLTGTHQILTIDLDREITIVLIKFHLASVRGSGSG
jgi:hypothetical protein